MIVETNTMAEQNREELDAAYVRSLADVLRHLNEIHNLIHELPAPDSAHLNWEHVGTMNKVKSDLQDVARSLAGNDE